MPFLHPHTTEGLLSPPLKTALRECFTLARIHAEGRGAQGLRAQRGAA